MSQTRLPNFQVIDDEGLFTGFPASHDKYNSTRSDDTDGYSSLSGVNSSNAEKEAPSSFQSYASYPRGDHTVMPFRHAMKRGTDNRVLSDIFGTKQDFSRFDKIAPQTRDSAHSLPSYQRPPSQHFAGSSVTGSMSELPKVQFIGEFEHLMNENRAGPNNSQRMPSEGSHKGQNSQRQQVYNAVIEHFPGFVMTKTKIVGRHSVYKAVASCLLCDGVRYVVAITANDPSPVGTKSPLSLLKWESFQTRFQDDDSEVKQFRLQSAKQEKPFGTILSDIIRLSRKTSTSNVYLCDNLPLLVEVIRSKEDEFIAETGTVESALDLFSTVLSFTD